MNEPILLPIEYLGVSYEFPLILAQRGYTYQLHFDIQGQVLIFEKDDVGEYRVVGNADSDGQIDKGLIRAIVATLEKLQSGD